MSDSRIKTAILRDTANANDWAGFLSAAAQRPKAANRTSSSIKVALATPPIVPRIMSTQANPAAAVPRIAPVTASTKPQPQSQAPSRSPLSLPLAGGTSMPNWKPPSQTGIRAATPPATATAPTARAKPNMMAGMPLEGGGTSSGFAPPARKLDSSVMQPGADDPNYASLPWRPGRAIAGGLTAATAGVGYGVGQAGRGVSRLMGDKPGAAGWDEFTNRMGQGVGAGLHDATDQLFTGQSALSGLNAKNVEGLQQAAKPSLVNPVTGQFDETPSSLATLASGGQKLTNAAGHGIAALTGAKAVPGGGALNPNVGKAVAVGGAVGAPLWWGAGGEAGADAYKSIVKPDEQAAQMRNMKADTSLKEQATIDSRINSNPQLAQQRAAWNQQQQAANPAAQQPGAAQPLTRESLAAITPEDAQAKAQAAHQNLSTLPQRASQMPPEQAKTEITAGMKDALTPAAKAAGDPSKLLTDAQAPLTPEKAQAVAQTPFGQELAAKNPQNPLEAITGFFSDPNTPTWQKVLAGAGVPMAVMGLASSLFGEGGMGSMLMTILGIGGAAAGLGLFSGEGGGPLGSFGKQYGLDQVGTLLGAGQASPEAPPASMPPLSPQNAQAAAGTALGAGQAAAQGQAAGPLGAVLGGGRAALGAFGKQQAASQAAQAQQSMGGFMADNKIDRGELKSIVGNPGLRQHLLQLPPQEQRKIVGAMRSGDPAFGQGLDKAKMGLKAPSMPMLGIDPKKMVYDTAQQNYGLDRQSLDALLRADPGAGGV